MKQQRATTGWEAIGLPTPICIEGDPTKRVQPMPVHRVFPIRGDGLCGCGCGQKLTGRAYRWAEREHGDNAYLVARILAGDSFALMRVCRLRAEMTGRTEEWMLYPSSARVGPLRPADAFLYGKPWGPGYPTEPYRHLVSERAIACECCNRFTINWQADHIVPVAHGGGLCGPDNIQALCHACHVAKTAEQAREKARKRRGQLVLEVGA